MAAITSDVSLAPQVCHGWCRDLTKCGRRCRIPNRRGLPGEAHPRAEANTIWSVAMLASWQKVQRGIPICRLLGFAKPHLPVCLFLAPSFLKVL